MIIMLTLHHDPRGYALNMGWCVRDSRGSELYRGPEWAARLRLGNPRILLNDALRQAQTPPRTRPGG